MVRAGHIPMTHVPAQLAQVRPSLPPSCLDRSGDVTRPQAVQPRACGFYDAALDEKAREGRDQRRATEAPSSLFVSFFLELIGIDGGNSPAWSLRAAAASTSPAATLGSGVVLAILRQRQCCLRATSNGQSLDKKVAGRGPGTHVACNYGISTGH
jgi:hypothetical protein